MHNTTHWMMLRSVEQNDKSRNRTTNRHQLIKPQQVRQYSKRQVVLSSQHVKGTYHFNYGTLVMVGIKQRIVVAQEIDPPHMFLILEKLK